MYYGKAMKQIKAKHYELCEEIRTAETIDGLEWISVCYFWQVALQYSELAEKYNDWRKKEIGKTTEETYTQFAKIAVERKEEITKEQKSC